ncbi:hypothetical protein ACWCP6_30260 [Streptomyces sp. NPDC002004]
MRATRRIIRTAAIATGAIAALAAPSAAAFADSAPAAQQSRTSRPGAEADRTWRGAYLITVKLADSSTAKIYRLGPHSYRADVYANGTRLDSLVARGRSAYGENNGLHIALHPDGSISSWVEGRFTPKPQPKPVPDHRKPALVAKVKLVDGSTAVIHQLGKNEYKADIYAHGVRIDTLVAKGKSVYGQNNGLHVALHRDGSLSSWTQ